MTRTLLALLAATALSAPAFADQIAVVNKGEDTLALVDPETLTVTATVPTGANPHEAWTAPDGSAVYVTDYGFAEGSTVTVIDPASAEVAATWSLGPNRGPHGVWSSADGSKLWVTTEGTGTVVELDAASGALLNTWETGQDVSHMIVPLPGGEKLYVTNIGSGTVTVINRADDSVATITAGAGAEGIDVAPDGSEVWVTSRDQGEIAIIDPAADEVIETISSQGEVPIRAKFTPDGSQVWVSNAGSNAVAVFDADSRAHLGSIDVGAVPVGVLMSPDGERAFVANTQDDKITIIDVASREVTGELVTGDEPDGMAWVSSAE